MTLRQAILHPADFGRIAIVRLLPNADETGAGGARLLLVVDEVETKVDVELGGTFEVKGQTWRLDDYELHDVDLTSDIAGGPPRYTVTITRVS